MRDIINFSNPLSFQIIFISQGGAGGDGGNGKKGASNLGQIPADPANAQAVVSMTSNYDYKKDCHHHCGGHCNACDEHWYHKLVVNIPSAACGGNGGDGGDGGNGGAAGILSISGALEGTLVAENRRLESAGGLAGTAAAGTSGLKVHREFPAWR